MIRSYGLALVLAACAGKDPETDTTAETDEDPVETDDSDDSDTDADTDAETDPPDTDVPDTDVPDTDLPDTDVPDTDPPPPCDADGDGFDHPGCGGPDCDDADPDVNPGAADPPNRRDDDCSGDADRDTIGDISAVWTSSPEFDERVTSIDNLAVGDVDGDGHLELVAGCPVGSGGAGGAYLFAGAGISAWTGDASADAQAILVPEGTLDALGFVALHLGDADGDGLDDLVVGARQTSDGGSVYVFTAAASLSGSVDVSDADGIIRGDASTGRLGWGVDGSGDLDGDGLADIAAGDSLYSSGTGRVGLFRAVPAGEVSIGDADATLYGDPGNRLGEMVTSGDANSDGYADLLLGAPGTKAKAGAVLLIPGGSSLPSGNVTDAASWQFTGSGTGEVGGNSRGTATPADLDDSGTPDLVIADYLDASAVYVFLDPAAGSVTATDADSSVSEPGIGLGSATKTGDLDGDGVPDLLVGSIYDSTVGTNAGSVGIVWGGPSAWSRSYTRGTLPALIDANGADEYVGTAVALPGDIDGDGRPDLAIGASWDSSLAVRGGTIWIVD